MSSINEILVKYPQLAKGVSILVQGCLNYEKGHNAVYEWDQLRAKEGTGKSKSANPGYHLTDIPRGVFGEPSKILEEARELVDADSQGVKIMCLAECSDIVGALVGYLEAKHPGVTMEDLIEMANVTKRAFESGHRT